MKIPRKTPLKVYNNLKRHIAKQTKTGQLLQYAQSKILLNE